MSLSFDEWFESVEGVDIEIVSKGVGMDINKVRELAVELGLA